METVEALVGRRDGAALKVLAQGGDADAAIAFADLVFDARYSGDLELHKTKKAAKDEAREDATRQVVQAAEAGSRAAMEKAADMYFMSVWEPGSFGSLILPASYKIAMGFYEKLIDLPDSTDAQMAHYCFRLGRCYQFRNQIKDRKSPEDVERVTSMFKRAREYPGTKEFVQATHCLSDLYWGQGKHEESVALASEILEDAPWAHMTVHLAYKQGLGVEQNDEKAQHHYATFMTLTQTKKRKKK